METPVVELINQIASQGLPAEGTDALGGLGSSSMDFPASRNAEPHCSHSPSVLVLACHRPA